MENIVKLNIEDLLNCINGKDSDGKDYKVQIPPHNKVKDEFNKFINQEISERRKKSSIGSMRKFHNFIKQTLLTVISNKLNEVNLLDIAVGRGGDMFKWNTAGISNVFGFDKNETSINSINPFDQGAKERLRLNKINTKVSYEVGDAMNPSADLVQKIINFDKIHPINIISCQFAMHFFFKSDTYLENVFKVFTPFLKKGGYFFGTTVDGKKIKEQLTKEPVNLFEIKKTKVKNEYTFKINDIFDKGNYFNSTGESTEYLVDFEKLITLASKYNLKPVFLNFFESIPGTKGYATNNIYNPHFVSFEEIYNLPNHGNWKGKLSPDEIILNSLYSTFVFVKI
jgi:mRNA (guanine-N7-)-methyltransferase